MMVLSGLLGGSHGFEGWLYKDTWRMMELVSKVRITLIMVTSGYICSYIAPPRYSKTCPEFQGLYTV